MLITGANGFLGSHLTKHFFNLGVSVFALVRSDSDLYRLQDLKKGINIIEYDRYAVQQVLTENQFDVCIHTACNYGRMDPSIYKIWKANLDFSLEILNLCAENNVVTFINCDTLMPKDVNAYALSKEHFRECLSFFKDKLQIINVKTEFMYGAQDAKNKFLNSIFNELWLNTPEIALTQCTQKRDFIYIDDVVSAFQKIVENRVFLGVLEELELGTGVAMPLNEILEKLRTIFDERVTESGTKFKFGAIPNRENEPDLLRANISKVVALGWKPKYSLDHGLVCFIENEVRRYE